MCPIATLLACRTKGGTLLGLYVDDENGFLDQRGHVVYVRVGEGQPVVKAPVAQGSRFI